MKVVSASSYTTKKFIRLYPYIISLLTIACFVLIFFESVPYLKFIVSTLHLNTLVFQILLLLAWINLLFQRGFSNVKILIVTLIICIVGESTAKTTLSIFREMRNIVKDPFLSYDQKMSRTYKGFYPAMKEVVRLTPVDSTIIIPPQGNPWEMEGHVAMVTYFIYPRRAININLYSEQLPKVNGKLYALIAKGSWERTGSVDYGWPKMPINSSNIWHIDTDQNITTKFQKDYDPNLDKWDWGLIEVKQ